MWRQNYCHRLQSPSRAPTKSILQPQSITTMYIQLQMIINRQFVVLHTRTQKFFHTQYSREMQDMFRRAHNNKIQYFIEPFLIRSVGCKRNHVWWSFLSSPLILSRLTTTVVVFCLALAAGSDVTYDTEASKCVSSKQCNFSRSCFQRITWLMKNKASLSVHVRVSECSKLQILLNEFSFRLIQLHF